MPTWEPDRGEWMAIVVGLVLAGAVAALLSVYVGWLGVGLVGLIGLVITGQLTLHGGRAVPDADFSTLGRQFDEEDHAPPEQKMARWAEQDKLSAVVYFINTFCIALAALGFVLFGVHLF